jgi:ABC-type multidrug transport system fused ATPase/permease subunit
MGFVLEGLDKEAYDREYGDRELIRRIQTYFRPHLRTMLIVVLMVSLSAVVETGIPILISRGIDALGLEGGRPTNLALLMGFAAVVLGLSCFSWVFNYIRRSFSARAVGDVVLKLREDAFNAVTNRDLSFYDEFSSGKIVSRVTSDTQDFSTTVTLVMDLMSQVLLIILITTVLFSINVQLTLYTLLVAPAAVIIALGFRHMARTTIRGAQRARADVNSMVQESVSGIAVAKAFRQEGAIYNDFVPLNQRAFRVNLFSGMVFSSIFPMIDVLFGIGTGLVVYFGGLRVLNSVVSAGDWYLFVQGLGYFIFPLTSIASFWSQFQQGLSASERVFALIDAEPRVVQRAAEPTPEIKGRIEFRDVHFSYATGAVVLPGFSLTIPAGETLAVVGHTGAGKSSLARLIARFYEFQEGEILIDGHDIRTLDLSQYRRHLGLVPQTPFLFSGTVADNIRYGRQEATDDEVAEAARQIGGGEWVDLLPNGLQTDVGERGAALSAGQRQLVALARVLLHDPSILILDEATASVDPFTEAQIQEGLDIVMRDRTSIVIAHRLSTVKNADRIIVLQSGKVIEQGNHDELLRHGGHYAELYNTYFRHQSLEYIEQVGSV